ncbi:MAG TPA: Bax inhibitor-1/YccA family protein [Stellaceae bacterium]|nr:Bax inhibitor-1/YccA family protein [Stellaceae bacterium]
MSYGSQNPWSAARPAVDRAGYDLGLRQHMLRVYNYMATGLATTGAVAWLAYDTGFVHQIWTTGLRWVVILAPLVVVFALSAMINRMSVAAARLAFLFYAALLGLSLSIIFLAYTGTSIAETFFVTAATFLGMSLYGYTTKSDLTRFGSFLVMGLIGIVIASLVNIFLASPGLQFAISVIGVIVFTGLTAWDTQRIKEQYDASYGGEAVGRLAIMGALMLYLDFINLFLMLLQLFGDRRN